MQSTQSIPPRVYIAGDAAKYHRYGLAIKKAGGVPVFAQDTQIFTQDAQIYAQNAKDTRIFTRDAQDSQDAQIYASNNIINNINICDALLLPGGGDVEPWRYGQKNLYARNINPERDAWEFNLLRDYWRNKKPILGICRGLQVINIFFGGDLFQDIPGHNQINGIDQTHRIYFDKNYQDYYKNNNLDYNNNDNMLFGESDILSVNSAHHQAAGRLGGGLYAVRRAEDGVIEALAHENAPVFGVQWHPERLYNSIGENLFRGFVELVRRNCENYI